MHKRIQIIKGPLKVDNPITSKLIDLRCGYFLYFCRNNIEAEIRILRSMYDRIDFVRMPHKGWIKNGSSFAQNG